MIRSALAFAVAVLMSFVLASAAHSHFVMRRLEAVGASIPVPLGLKTMTGDLLGLAPSLLPVMAVALLLGFLVAWLAKRGLPGLAPLAYPLAGFAAMALMLVLMREVMFKITPIAGARGPEGFLTFCAIGALGGFVFSRLAAPRRA